MIKNLKVSPSMLDSFNNLLLGKYNETEQRIIDKINHVAEYQQTEAMFKGTAFHKLTENMPDGLQVKNGNYQFEFWEFNKNIVDDVVKIRSTKLHERWVSNILPTSKFGDVLLYGIVDDIGGGEIFDVKTTKNYYDLSYFSSYQWRLYLYCSNANSLTYVITDFTNLYFEQYQPYNGMDKSLEEICTRYFEFVHDNKDKIDLKFVTKNE